MNLKQISTLIGSRLGLKTAQPESDTVETASSPAPPPPSLQETDPNSQAAEAHRQLASAVADNAQATATLAAFEVAEREQKPERLDSVASVSERIEVPPEQEPADRRAVEEKTDVPVVNHFVFEDSTMEDDEFLITDYSPEQLAKSKQKLTELMRSCSGVYGVLIHTVDGHDLQSVVTRDIPGAKISTMTSSFLALGETIARESLQKFCQYAMLENSNGRVVSLRINDILMLTCISTKDSNAGMLLSLGKSAAEALSKILIYRP